MTKRERAVKYIKSYIVVILITTLLCTLLGFLYSNIRLKANYRVTNTLMYATQSEAKINNAKYQLLEANEWLTQMNMSKNEITDIRHNLLVNSAKNAKEMQITVQASSENEAHKIANSISRFVYQKTNALALNTGSATHIPPPIKKVTFISFCLGLFLAFFLAISVQQSYKDFVHEKMDKLLNQNDVQIKQVTPVFFLVKRGMDIVFGTIGTFITFVLYLIFLIPYSYGENKGPILFKQKRLGFYGESFAVYKFRSMKVNAESYLKNDSTLYKKYVENDFKLPLEEDPRITKFGRFIRKTSLDEFPQFINVISGDMSLVGPRPIVKDELSEYGNKAKYFLAMKPGITGVWGISGRSNIEYPQRVGVELSYLKKRSIHFDFYVIYATIKAIFKKDGVQ
jgi:lipopolysaccharide/colanic/teichoic acid biosynthesis glycosyltransferase